MITGNILDYLNNIIGTITFPDGTDQNTINSAVALYTIANPVTITPAIVNTITLSQVSPITNSASTPQVMQGLSDIPPKGTYVVQFSGSVNTNGSSASGTFGIFVNGALLPETNRPVSCNLSLLGGLVTVSLNAIGVGTYSGTQVILDGNSTIDVRFASTNGGTIGFTERVLTLLKVA